MAKKRKNRQIRAAPIQPSGILQYGFAVGDGAIAVIRNCSSRPGEKRRWASIDVLAGRERIRIEATATKVWIERKPRMVDQ